VQLLPAPGERRRLAILLAILIVVAAAAPVVRATGGDDSEPARWLAGRTEQGRSLRLLVEEGGGVTAVDAHVESRCKGGYRWGVDWTPAEGWARFTNRGGRVAVRELRTRRDGEGNLQRVLVRLVGRVRSESGSGTIRLQARFYRGGVERQACDSGARRWAVGDHVARRLAAAPPQRPSGGSYWPRVPSLAGKLSPGRRRFVARTDQTCVDTFGPTQVALRAVNAAAGDARRQLEAYGAYVEAHAAQLRALEALGTPPDGVELHRRWLENFRTRVRMERRLQRLWAAGEIAAARAVDRRLGPLKIKGNTAGQRFGLQVCTSNGPDRTPARR
jgi:hypothetical protein